jgi:hypothetical protein
MGAVAHVVTSGSDNPPIVMRAVRGARYKTLGTTARRCAGKSRSSRSSSVSNRSSRHVVMACLLGIGRASSMSSRRATRRRMRRCHSRTPRRCSRMSTTTPTPTPTPTSIASSSTSCMAAPETSHPGALSRHCAVRWQQLHQRQERHPTTSGWRRPLTLMLPTARRT